MPGPDGARPPPDTYAEWATELARTGWLLLRDESTGVFKRTLEAYDTWISRRPR